MHSPPAASNTRAYIILIVIGTTLLGSYIYLLRGMLTLSHPPPQALATSTISAMYTRQANLTSRCETVIDEDGHEQDCALARLIDYCGVEPPTGTEGVKSAIPSADWHIEHLILNIRHGDRSAIHAIENTFKPHPYEGSGDLQSPKILQRLRVASKFRVEPMSSVEHMEPRTSEGYSIHNYNPIDSFMEVSDRHLISGQLTTVGFYQHILLGEHLQGSYMPLLRQLQGPSQSPLLSIRSTAYNRTIQSVAGMLSSFLPPSVQYSEVRIKINPHLSLENMHGFVSNKVHVSSSPVPGGQISVYKNENTPVEIKPNVPSNCPRATYALKRMSKSYEDTNPETYQRLVNIYSPAIMKPFGSISHITDVADPLLASFCHQEKYACGVESNKCGSDSLARAVMIDSDRAFCERYTSAYGGLDYTRLDIYPFMTEIRDAILSAAENAYKRASGESNEMPRGPLVHVFSGHDTVIAPVLTALGIYQHSRFCKWPDYASRIAFEAWNPVGKNLKKYPLNRDGETKFNVKSSNMHIRVVYNGEDVTHHMSACASSSIKFVKKGVKSSLCPIGLFVQQIESNLGSSSSLEEACEL